MNFFIQVAVVPVVTGLLTGLIFLLIVNLRDPKTHMDFLLKVLGGIATLGITLFGIRSSAQQSLCEKQEKLATEIVELLHSVTLAATNEIGLPKYCHNRSGLPVFFDDQSIVDANNKFNRNTDVLNFKIIPLIKTDVEIAKAKNAYDNAMIDLMKQCIKDPDFSPDVFFNKQSVLNDTRSKLVSRLGIFLANNCY